LVLQRSGAPLGFWCYGLIFVVDCLNHIAKKPLGWKISSEVLNGDTPDISPFRFKFYAAKQPFPKYRWIQGRFLEISWETSDLFTFLVWSELDGRWQDGQEFIRNVVRKRDKDEVLPPTMPDPNLGTFRFKRQYRTRKRKKGTEFVYQMRDVPEGNLESNPVACSNTEVENSMASGEERPDEENPVAAGE